MKEKNDLFLPFFYLGGDVLIGLFANLGILSYAFSYLPRRFDFLILGFTVFGIYLLDRTYDSLKESAGMQTNRGRFYLPKTRITFLIGMISLMLSFTLAVVFYEPKFFFGGLLLGFLVAIYLLLHYFLKGSLFPKEILISLLYTLGAGYPIYYFNSPDSLAKLLVYILFFLSILCVVLFLSLEDLEWDQNQKLPSLAILLGKIKTKKWIHILLSLGFIFGIFLYAQPTRLGFVGLGYLAYFLVMSQMPTFISRFPVEVRKVLLEISYLPFLMYYFL